MNAGRFHLALAGAAASLAVLAVAIGEPQGEKAELRRGEVSAPTVARWIHDRLPGLTILDLRAKEEYAAGHLPGAERVDGEVRPATLPRAARVVAYGGDAEAGALAARLRREGIEAFRLRGGYAAWEEEVLAPRIPDGAGDREPYKTRAALSRYFGGRPRVGPAPPRSWRGC